MNRTEIIFLKGGLGNQMFQYAFYLIRAQNQKFKVIHDTTWFRHNRCHNGYELFKVFGIPESNSNKRYYLLKLLQRLQRLGYIPSRLKIIEDTMPSTYFSSFDLSDINYFDGYWQVAKYYDKYKNLIREVFKFDIEKLSDFSIRILDLIRTSEYPVSVHIRRGDYLHPKFRHLYGNICTPEYYEKAIGDILSNNPKANFFVFSDDVSWVKNNIKLPNALYVDHNKGLDSWQDMYLMSKCKDNVIANSSFSWWAAWLNSNETKTVYAPMRFMNLSSECDIIPESWIKL